MKKTIRFFALLAVAGAMTFAGCSKDDEDDAKPAESLQITFANEVIPMGWHNYTFDGELAQIEAASAMAYDSTKGSRINVYLPYAQFQFNEDGIFNAYYNENNSRIVDGICEWAYDEDLSKNFSISGFDATALTIESVIASMTMYDYYANENDFEIVDEQPMTVSAANITLLVTNDNKAKKNYVFHN